MSKHQKRAVISSILLIVCIVLFGTGAVLYFVQRGMWWVFPRYLIKDIHGICAIVMAVCLLGHLILNWSMYRKEIKSLFQKTQNKDDQDNL